jgi:hypothetical protein
MTLALEASCYREEVLAPCIKKCKPSACAHQVLETLFKSHPTPALGVPFFGSLVGKDINTVSVVHSSLSRKPERKVGI